MKQSTYSILDDQEVLLNEKIFDDQNNLVHSIDYSLLLVEGNNQVAVSDWVLINACPALSVMPLSPVTTTLP